MSASSPGVHPQDVLEPKVLPERRVDHLDRHGHEGPALVAYIRFVAARADLIVVCEIDVEDQLLGNGLEGAGFAERLPVSRVGAVDGADFETGGV